MKSNFIWRSEACHKRGIQAPGRQHSIWIGPLKARTSRYLRSHKGDEQCVPWSRLEFAFGKSCEKSTPLLWEDPF